ncbi:MAG: hypothetical protein JXI43_03785 [Tissierellales bacterium]|nr:hypothetical protein [Tissierellales bacterium]
MDYRIILIFVFFVILVSLQYTLNKILNEIRDIKRLLRIKRENGKDELL